MYSKQTMCHTHTAHGKHGSVGVEKHSSKVGLWHTAASGAPVVFTVTQCSLSQDQTCFNYSSILAAPPCTSFQSTEKPLGHTQKKQMEQFSLFLSTIRVAPLSKSASSHIDKLSVVCSIIHEIHNLS